MNKTINYNSKYGTYTIYFKAGRYPNKRLAVALFDAEDGCEITKATVNIPIADLSDDEVIIKDYSGNEGLLSWLIKNGFVTQPKRHIKSGFVECPVVDVLPKLLEYCGIN